MIDFLVAAVAALLVMLGLAIIAGPELPRIARGLIAMIRQTRARWRYEQGEPAADPESKSGRTGGAVTLRAIASATNAATLLKRHGHDELASRLAYAARRLPVDEAAGLRTILALRRRLDRVRLTDEASQAALDRALRELNSAVVDRAEQLELLPFPG